MKWRAAVDRATAPLGLSHAHYSLLGSLLSMQSSGRMPSQRELADYCGLEPLYVSKLARTLDQAGLINRVPNPADTRAVQLSLTDRGKEVTSRAITIVQQLMDHLLQPLGGLNGQQTAEFSRELAVLLDVPHCAPAKELMMTDSPAPMLNPQITGKAERALGAILDRLLARTGTSFPQWTILAVTAAKGGSAGRDQLVAAIADGKIPESAVLTAISELTAAQLLETGLEQQIQFTEAGRARHRQIQTAIEEITSRIFDFPADDLATAGRVLTTVASRASTELASV